MRTLSVVTSAATQQAHCLGRVKYDTSAGMMLLVNKMAASLGDRICLQPNQCAQQPDSRQDVQLSEACHQRCCCMNARCSRGTCQLAQLLLFQQQAPLMRFLLCCLQLPLGLLLLGARLSLPALCVLSRSIKVTSSWFFSSCLQPMHK